MFIKSLALIKVLAESEGGKSGQKNTIYLSYIKAIQLEFFMVKISYE